MKRFAPLILLLIPILIKGQGLTLDQCYTQARSNFPLVQQQGLVTALSEFNIANVHSARYPQVMLAAQATYQSAVTRIPI
ncbi:MAG: transporter, partial [Bacteroidota bacterium]